MNSGKRNTPPYSPKPERDEEKDRRRRDRDSCSTRKSTIGCVLRGDSSHQSITAERHDRHDREAEDQRVAEPVLLSPLLEHVLQRRETDDQQPDARPVDRLGRAAACPADRAETSSTRNTDTMPIGTLMKKHQFQCSCP